MSINPETQYPGKIAPSSPQYPYGQGRNITLPGDGTGTPWEAALLNDIFGFQQALLSDAGVVPSGSPDEVGASQYLQSMFKSSGLVRADQAALRLIESSQLSDGTSACLTDLGSGGFYTLDKTDAVSTDDTGLVVVDADAGRWKRVFNFSAVNIMWYGAKTTGDATVAMQAAIDSDYDVFTPDGTFSFTSLTLKAEKKYFGTSMERSKWLHTGGAVDAISYTAVPSAKVQFSDMWLAGNGVDTARTLYLKNANFNAFLTRVRVNDGVINVYLQDSWTFTFDGCHIFGAGNNDKGITQNNIYTDGWEAGVLNNSRVEDCLGDNIVIDQIAGQATNFFNISGATKIQRCNGRAIYAKVGQGAIHAYFERVNDDNLASDTITVTGATQANPVVITAANTLNDGDVVDMSGIVGMTELNGNTYTVVTASASGFTLEGIDGTGFTAYTSGGVATQYTAAIQFNEGGFSEIKNTYLTNSGADTRFVNFNGTSLNMQSNNQSSSGGAKGIYTSNTTDQFVTIASRYFVATPYDLNSNNNVVLDQLTDIQMVEGSILVGDPTQLDALAYALDVYAESKHIRLSGNTNLNIELDSPANRALDVIFKAAGVNKIVMGRGDSDTVGNNVIYFSTVSSDLDPPLSVDVVSGQVRMSDLPTSDPGGSGNLWNNAGVLNIT